MKNPQQNLVVYLKDICLPELELLLEFVYTGEVKVHREQLQTLLASGRELGFKGMEVSFGDHLEVDLGGGAHIGGKEEGIQVAQVGNGRTESDQQQIEINGKSENLPMMGSTESGFEECQMGMDLTNQKAHTDVMFRLNKQIKQRTTGGTHKSSKHPANRQKSFLGSTADGMSIRNSPALQETTKIKGRHPAVFTCDTCGTVFGKSNS